jgi:hypothetical protein
VKRLYTFKVVLAHRRGQWRRFEIRGDQTLRDLDRAIRDAFGHDFLDHLSEFYPPEGWRWGFGEIRPDGSGEGAGVKIDELGLFEGGELGYIYDFGSEIRHILTLEKIGEAVGDVKYPRMISRSKPRYRYCERCREQGRKTIATWVCVHCSEEAGRGVFLCDECLEEHGDHYAEEMHY